MFGLHPIDLVVILGYFAFIVAIGIWAARLVRNMGDYFMPRRFGKLMLVAHNFGTGTHSDQAVSVASKSFSVGLSGIWYQWLWLFATPFYWLIAPMMRRFRAITISDVFTLRFNRSVGMLFGIVGTVQLSFNIGVMLKGSGAVISACFGNSVSPNVIILVMTVLFVLYGVAGGLAAAIVTDFLQGILTVVFSFALLPLAMQAVGGMDGLRETISDPSFFSLVAPGEIGVFYITVIALNALVGIVAQPHTMGGCAAGRTELDGRVGFVFGSLIKRICTMAWCLTGLAALAYLGAEVNPDEVYGIMARDFLPVLLPGLLGVFLASLLASVMSSCDSFMIASSALFTENIYKELRPNRSEQHYLRVGRITSLFIVAGGVFSAYSLTSVVQGLEIFWKIAPMLGIAFWLGLFWRRTTTAGAWAATLGGFATWWLTTQSFFLDIVQELPWSTITETEGTVSMSLPWQMVCYLTMGLVAGIVVSLLTKPESEERLDRFYALVRTPVNKGEPPPTTPCVIPDGVQIPEKRLLLPWRGLEILVPGRLSLIGFTTCWIVILLMIAVFYGFTR
jgi:Na+/proline symporter